ncbi:hypothetical protein BREVNS_0530 [Brevinematales bacterium NS]|nr:hypothetical protein BREVNS_0530 [Brevinematales bacterium NS]
MKQEEFEFLLQQGEGLRLEFKESFDAKNIAKEMVAFANTEGGRIFIGVTDEGEVKGIPISNKLKAEIMDVRPLHGCFLPLSGSGAMPLKPRFFCLQGPVCLFYSKKLVYLLQHGIF